MSSSKGQHYRWTFGAGEFDEATLKFTIDGKPVGLEPKARDLVVTCLSHFFKKRSRCR